MFSGCSGFLGGKWRSIRSYGAGGCGRGGRNGERGASPGLQCVSCLSPRHLHISQEGFHFAEKQLNSGQNSQKVFIFIFSCMYFKVNMISNCCQDDLNLSVMKNTHILKTVGSNREYYSDIKLFRIGRRGSIFLLLVETDGLHHHSGHLNICFNTSYSCEGHYG